MKNKKNDKTKVAILAWGSLLWNSKGLSIGKFMPNGPTLPLEFSRISKDGRLTLVIDPVNGKECETFFAISKHHDIDKVLKEFQKREHIKDKLLNVQIGAWDIKHGFFNQGAAKYPQIIFDQIFDWAKNHKIDGVIFSALARKFKQKLEIPYTNENAYMYLNSLEEKTKIKAIKYIQNSKIDTNFKQYFIENYQE